MSNGGMVRRREKSLCISRDFIQYLIPSHYIWKLGPIGHLSQIFVPLLEVQCRAIVLFSTVVLYLCQRLIVSVWPASIRTWHEKQSCGAMDREREIEVSASISRPILLTDPSETIFVNWSLLIIWTKYLSLYWKSNAGPFSYFLQQFCVCVRDWLSVCDLHW